MTIIRPDIGIIYSVLTAKCIDLSLLIDYSTYFKNVTPPPKINVFRPFGPQLGPNIKGQRAPRAPPLDPTLLLSIQSSSVFFTMEISQIQLILVSASA